MAYPPLTDLFHQLDSRLPHGDYRIPSLVTTLNGTLLAFVGGRFHRTDVTPNILYMRRSEDDGLTWGKAIAVLRDAQNGTEYGGAPLVDPATGVVHLVFRRIVRVRALIVVRSVRVDCLRLFLKLSFV